MTIILPDSLQSSVEAFQTHPYKEVMLAGAPCLLNDNWPCVGPLKSYIPCLVPPKNVKIRGWESTEGSTFSLSISYAHYLILLYLNCLLYVLSIYCQCINPEKGGHKQILVVPKSLVAIACSIVHNDSHLGKRKTLAKAKQYFYCSTFLRHPSLANRLKDIEQ